MAEHTYYCCSNKSEENLLLEEGLYLHRNRGQLRQGQPGRLLNIGEKRKKTRNEKQNVTRGGAGRKYTAESASGWCVYL